MLKARQGVLVYLGAVFAISLPVEVLMIRQGKMSPGLVALLMWAPALSSFVARILLREGIRDVSFRLSGPRFWRAVLLAWSYPLLVGSIAYGVGWGAGLAPFQGTAAAFLRQLGLACSLLLIDGVLLAAGEEIGWRGYLLTRLIDAGVPRPVLVSGLIWALWHAPLLTSGAYPRGPSIALSLIMFTVTVVAVSSVMARGRLGTGSVWPAIVLHGTWNAVIQGAFDPFTGGRSIWLGETGVLVAAASAAVALCASAARGPLQATPFQDAAR